MAVNNDWTPPASFDEYRLVSLLGRGGMGEVYLGHDTLLARPVAIKFIRTRQPDIGLRELILNEARAAARIQHPNVPIIYRVGEIDGQPYIISEFIRGRSLDRIPKPMPWQRVLRVGIGLARALSAAHRRGVLHRDIKPGNSILSDGDEIKLLDFGLAKFVDAAARVEEPRGESMVVSVQDGHHGLNGGGLLLPGGASAIQLSTGSAGLAATAVLDAVTRAPIPIPNLGMLNTPTVNKARQNGQQTAEKEKERDKDKEKERTSAGIIKGTPLYMAPELWRGDPASRRSDVYSMGALLYELCSGDPPHANLSIAQLANLTSKQSAPPLLKVAPEVDPRLAAIIDRCLRHEASERYSSGEDLREALEALEAARGTQKLMILPDGNPYRGLLAFEAEHRMMFFGRSNEIGTVLERLRSESFVLVAADSGLGKSSLCRAGILPRVEEGALGGGRRWDTVTLLPGRHPLHSLASALSPLLHEPAQVLAERWRSQPAAFADTLEAFLGEGRGLVLFIDQMEELISLSYESEAAAVSTALGGLIDRLRAVRLLGTARSDFLARLATLPGLGDDLSRTLYLLRPLSRDKLRDVIVGPAQAKGVRFESDGLVETLIDSTARAEGGLPLLQFALAELWDAHKDNSITAMALADIGGVAGALARHADHVILGLPQEQRTAARHILMSLVTLEGTRARKRESELLVELEARPALDALLRGRLLIARDVGGGAVYELAHEALIKGWSTLRRWIDEHAEIDAIRQSLERAAASWIRLGRTKEALWGERQLAEIAPLERERLSPSEKEFVSASERQIRSSRRLRVSLSGLLPIGLLLLYAAMQFKTRADLNRRVLTLATQAKQTLAQAQKASSAANARRQRALAAFDEEYTDIGEQEWKQMRALEIEANQHYPRSIQTLESALALDSGRDDLRSLLGEVLYERALQADRDHEIGRRDELLQRMAAYDGSGALLKRFHSPGHLRLASDPPGAMIHIAQYRDSGDRKQLSPERELGRTPLSEIELPQGSYMLILRAPGRAELRYPLLVGRNEQLDLKLTLAAVDSVPPGYIYVPAGRFLLGTAADDTLRQSFLSTVPLHSVATGPYLIAQHETTYAEWIEYLRTLPRPKKVHHRRHHSRDGEAGSEEPAPPEPSTEPVSLAMANSLNLTARHGVWQLTLPLLSYLYRVRQDEPLTYDGRKDHAVQDWLNMPVSGVSLDEAMAYAAYLDSSGKIPGARLCTEQEWERAARGADDREFPIGNTLAAGDANFDLTYGKDRSLMGPDEVGTHIAARSPFGVDDMAGNVVIERA